MSDIMLDYLTQSEDVPNEVEQEVSQGYDDNYDEEADAEDVDIEDKEYVEPVVYEGTLPSYFPENLIPPKEFESEDDELKFYRDNYFKTFDVLQTEDFVKDFFTTYEKQITQTDEDFEDFKALQGAFHDNPELAFKRFFPEVLSKQGYKTAFSSDERNDLLRDMMVEEFGENYKAVYVPEEASNPKSLSYRMIQIQEKALAKIEKMDQENKALEDKFKPISKDVVQAKIDAAYETEFKEHMSKEEYASFIKQADEYEMSLIDVYKIVNYDNLVKAYQNKAYNQGRKDALGELKKAKTKLPEPVRQRPAESRNNNTKLDLREVRNLIYN